MTLLFIVTSFWAYGELLIACEFAVRAQRAGHTCLFLIPPSHERVVKEYGIEYTPLIPGADNINRMLLQDLEHTRRPDLVVLADFLNYTFCERHYGLVPEDLKLFSGRIGTFDDFHWQLTRQRVDTYGFRARDLGSLSVDEYDFTLRPCPLNIPGQGAPDRQHFDYALLDLPVERSPQLRSAARERLGLSAGAKVVLTTTATWQHTYKAYPNVVAFVQLCTQLKERIFADLGPDTRLIAVGSASLFQGQAPSHVMQMSSVPPSEFQTLIQAADLFVSDNVTSTTLARAALSGVPALALYSSLRRDAPGHLKGAPHLAGPLRKAAEESEHLYPFRMFPVGWYHFLAPLLRANPFVDLMEHCEIFDTDRATGLIQELLGGGPHTERLQGKVADYRERLEQLPPVSEILERLAASRSATGRSE